VPRGWCGAVVIPLIWAYTAATGWQSSAIRSTIMMTVIIGGWSLKRPNDLLNSLAAAAFLILLWDPQQLFQASFQLSFFVVLSLALFAPWLGEQSEDLLTPDEFLPDELRSWWQLWLWRGWRWLRLSCVTSVAAWLGSIPLVAYYFNLITPVSLLANLIIVPLSGLALASNVASLALGSIWPALAELFNHSAWLWMKLMIDGSVLAARVPGGCFHVGTPTVLMFVTYYGVLITCLAGWWKHPAWRWWIRSALVLLTMASIVQWQMRHREMRLTILPLSGGSAQHFHSASHDFLIDCGNPSAAEFIIKPYLRSEGIDRLDTLLLTHGDVHHVGGAGFISQQFPPARVARSPVAFRSTAYREAIGQFTQRTNLLQTVDRGEVIEGWEVLHPEATDRFPQADDNAIVLRADLRGTRVLLLSDLGKPGQNALLGREQDLRADIVVSGIPTQTEPLAEALLDAIQPRLIVISDSVYPATARASQRLRERLAARNIPTIFTSETGAVSISLKEGSWEVRSAAGRKIEPRSQKTELE
jgi:competence protein ComEC